ncbi:MAG: NUDIX hydrolase [Pseudomonadota bacterium]
MKPSFSDRTPPEDTLPRAICDHCGFVAYDNPKIVVGAVVEHDGAVLLCRRAIQPSLGRWTIPAGYMEHGETPEEGARREAFEEAAAKIEIVSLLAVYTIKRIGQVQLIYRARLEGPSFAPGPESQAVALFARPDIPHEELAFPSVSWALGQSAAAGGPFVNPPGADERPRF